MEKQADPPSIKRGGGLTNCLSYGGFPTKDYNQPDAFKYARGACLIAIWAKCIPSIRATRTTPRFSKDYPPTLTAHDIGVKDLLDAFYMQGGTREVVLYAIAIDPKQPISMDLSDGCAKAAEVAVREILAELGAAADGA